MLRFTPFTCIHLQRILASQRSLFFINVTVDVVGVRVGVVDVTAGT